MLRISLAIAASVCTMAVASTSFAQEVGTDPSMQQPQLPAPPQQQQPVPTTTPQPQPTPTEGTTPMTGTITPPPDAVPPPAPPVSTTTTTQGAYPASNDSIVEKTETNRPNRKVLVTGGSIFALSYGASVVVAAQSDRDSDKRLYIPGVGPWLALGQRNCDGAAPCGDNDNVAKAFIIASGAAQGVGIIMAVSSLFIPERERVQVRQAAVKPEVKVLPLTFAGGGGLGAIGRF